MTCLTVAAAAGCGSRGSLASGGADARCALPASFVSQSCRLSTASCALGGVDPVGVKHELACDGKACTWSRDGRRACDCGRLDYANTCSNGVPLCAAWKPPFNFATLSCVRE
jgi:hypothetical protein